MQTLGGCGQFARARQKRSALFGRQGLGGMQGNRCVFRTFRRKSVIQVSGGTLYGFAMPSRAPDWFSQSLASLTNTDPLRVWSVIVTLFGDLARGRDDRISGPVLTRIMAPLGIRPEAMRVALHRLRQDGWIQSQKSGRSSYYGLSPSARAETDAARPRIYASGPKPEGAWHLVVLPPKPAATRDRLEGELSGNDGVLVAPSVYLLGGDPLPVDAALLTLSGTDLRVPDWLRARIMPAALRDGYRDLEAALDALAATMPDPHGLSPLQVAALRVAIVHSWRRLLLSHPDLPPRFFSADWRGEAARAQVMALLARLGCPDIASLEQDAEIRP